MLSNYEQAPLSPPASKGQPVEEWIQVYNNSGSDIANGAIKLVAYLVDTGTTFGNADTDNPVIVAYPLAPATNDTETNIVGVVDNQKQTISASEQYAGIHNAKFGWLKTKGVIKALVDDTSADVTVGDQLEVINGGTSFIVNSAASSGASGLITANTSAIALVAKTGNTSALTYVYLPGIPCSVKGS